MFLFDAAILLQHWCQYRHRVDFTSFCIYNLVSVSFVFTARCNLSNLL